jgi:hypothetical protein
MTLEEHSSSVVDVERNLDEESDESESEGAPVEGGLCRLDPPDSPLDEDAD